ncbi:MAG: dienelactone hydrolase [Pseudomonadota bacterium]|nr:dienelactone hydrolase [Pseudomonadota bacterium]
MRLAALLSAIPKRCGAARQWLALCLAASMAVGTGATPPPTSPPTPQPAPSAAQGRSASAVGYTRLRVPALAGPLTVFYPSADAAQAMPIGPYTLRVAPQGQPAAGNGRLIVISHGSGGSAVTYAELATTLVAAGFVVAVPEHEGDNWRDDRDSGPVSWQRRPHEISRAIDTVLRDARWAARLQAQAVGVYGMSAGGHTALTLAGGRWSPARGQAHCQAHLAQDFYGCVGLRAELTGGPQDAATLAAVREQLRAARPDPTEHTYTGPRVRAIVAEVPLAANFDPASLAQPVAPLGLIRASADRWLPPRFHVDAVRAACPACTLIADLPHAGHGALLAPAPQHLPPLAQRLLAGPAPLPAPLAQSTRQATAAFFLRHLTEAGKAPGRP